MALSKSKILNAPWCSSYCVTIDGNLYVTGFNVNGNLGLGDTSQRNSWIKIRDSGIVDNVEDIYVNTGGSADGFPFAAFLVTKDRNLWVTGYNEHGSLGLGDTTQRNSWTKVTTVGIAGLVKSVTTSFGGDHGRSASYCVTVGGELWVAGSNEYGDLGLGDTTNRRAWTRVTTAGLAGKVSSVVSVRNGDEASYGGSAYCITTDGNLWVAGKNGSGQLGLGDTAQRNTWTRVAQSGIAGETSSVSALRQGDTNSNSAYLITRSGNLFVTGYNGQGELGLGNTATRTTWTLVTTPGLIGNAVSVSAGGGFDGGGYGSAFCVSKDGALWATGYNSYGQLGLFDTAQRNSWTKTSLEGVTLVHIRQHGGDDPGTFAAYAVTATGVLWVAGYNGHGELGLGHTTDENRWMKASITGFVVNVYSAGGESTGSACCVTSDNNIWMAGYNGFGQLGFGDTTQRTSWTKVTAEGIAGKVAIAAITPSPTPSRSISPSNSTSAPLCSVQSRRLGSQSYFPVFILFVEDTSQALFRRWSDSMVP